MVWQSPNGKLLYRVGDILISTNSQNPSAWFGGTWQLLCPGRTLVCIDTSDGDFNTVKKTGGSKNVTLTTNQMPSHTHSQNAHNHGGAIGDNGWHSHLMFGNGTPTNRDLDASNPPATWATSTYSDQPYSMRIAGRSANVGLSAGSGSHGHGLSIYSATASNNYTGGSGAHTNLQPYMAVYMWVRTA